jgi:hypothetical protein
VLKQGDLTTYRHLNTAIIDYRSKQDKQNLSNFPPDTSSILKLQIFKQDPYRYLELQMLKDPMKFNVQEYVRSQDLAQYMSSWSSIKNKLKDMQVAAANLFLKAKKGFKFIDRALIEANLNPNQLKVYDSWSGYQKIVNYMNQIVTLGGVRQMKSRNLLITGPANIGKTSLFHNPNHGPDKVCAQDFIAVYPMGMSTWFPQYRSWVYKLIFWNQAKLTSYSYDLLLKFLEGSYVDLPTKGGVAPKRDNPLVIMTSNMTIGQMIHQKFRHDQDLRAMAQQNLAVRVQNVIVPRGYNLFLLQKLLMH